MANDVDLDQAFPQNDSVTLIWIVRMANSVYLNQTAENGK